MVGYDALTDSVNTLKCWKNMGRNKRHDVRSMETTTAAELLKASQTVRGIARHHSEALVPGTWSKGQDDTEPNLHAADSVAD